MGVFCARTFVRIGSLRRLARSWLCGAVFLAACACQSNTACAQVGGGGMGGNPPVIENFSAADLGGGVWELQGVVNASPAGGVYVSCWGAVVGSAYTADDGSFVITLYLGPMQPGGIVYAQAQGEGLQKSDVVETYIFNS